MWGVFRAPNIGRPPTTGRPRVGYAQALLGIILLGLVSFVLWMWVRPRVNATGANPPAEAAGALVWLGAHHPCRVVARAVCPRADPARGARGAGGHRRAPPLAGGRAGGAGDCGADRGRAHDGLAISIATRSLPSGTSARRLCRGARGLVGPVLAVLVGVCVWSLSTLVAFRARKGLVRGRRRVPPRPTAGSLSSGKLTIGGSRMAEQPKQRDADRSRAAILDAAETPVRRARLRCGHDGAGRRGGRGLARHARVLLRDEGGPLSGRDRACRCDAPHSGRDAARPRRRRRRVSRRPRRPRLSTRSWPCSRHGRSLVKLIDRENGIVSGEPHAEALRMRSKASATTGIGSRSSRSRCAGSRCHTPARLACWVSIRLLPGLPRSGVTRCWRRSVWPHAHPAAAGRTGPGRARHRAAAAETVDVAPPAGVPKPRLPVGERDEPPKKKKKKKKKTS